MIEVGTRKRNNFFYTAPPQGKFTRTQSNDLGLAKKLNGPGATGVVIIMATNGTLSANNGDFAAFVVNDVIEVGNSALNNGFFTVTAIDSVNHGYVVVSPKPQSEGNNTHFLRTT